MCLELGFRASRHGRDSRKRTAAYRAASTRQHHGRVCAAPGPGRDAVGAAAGGRGERVVNCGCKGKMNIGEELQFGVFS